MDAIDKLSHACLWQSEQNRIARNKFPSYNADPMYLVILADPETGDTQRLFLNHSFPVRRVQSADKCWMGSMFGYADTFRGDVDRCNLPIEQRWEIRSAQLLTKSARGIGSPSNTLTP